MAAPPPVFLTVRTPMGQTFIQPADPCEPVLSLKIRIGVELGFFDPEKFTLLFRGRELREGSVAEMGLADGSLVDFSLTLRSGRPLSAAHAQQLHMRHLLERLQASALPVSMLPHLLGCGLVPEPGLCVPGVPPSGAANTAASLDFDMDGTSRPTSASNCSGSELCSPSAEGCRSRQPPVLVLRAPLVPTATRPMLVPPPPASLCLTGVTATPTSSSSSPSPPANAFSPMCAAPSPVASHATCTPASTAAPTPPDAIATAPALRTIPASQPPVAAGAAAAAPPTVERTVPVRFQRAASAGERARYECRRRDTSAAPHASVAAGGPAIRRVFIRRHASCDPSASPPPASPVPPAQSPTPTAAEPKVRGRTRSRTRAAASASASVSVSAKATEATEAAARERELTVTLTKLAVLREQLRLKRLQRARACHRTATRLPSGALPSAAAPDPAPLSPAASRVCAGLPRDFLL